MPVGMFQDASLIVLGFKDESKIPPVTVGGLSEKLFCLPRSPIPDQSRILVWVSITVSWGWLIQNPSLPFTAISSVRLSIWEPGANSSIKSAIAGVPFSGSAPSASRTIHPESFVPFTPQVLVDAMEFVWLSSRPAS